LIDSKNFVCSATARTKTALDIVQFCFIYFAASLFKALGIHFFIEAKEQDVPAVSAFSPVSLLVYGDHPNFPTFWCPPKTPDHLTHTSQPKNSEGQWKEQNTKRQKFIACC